MSNQVIKRTRLKFVTVTSGLVLGIVLTFCIGILLSTYSRTENSIETVLKRMIDDRIRFASYPEPPNINTDTDTESGGTKVFFERINAMRGFTIVYSEEQSLLDARFNEEVFSKSEVEEYVRRVRESGLAEGRLENIRFMVQQQGADTIIAAMDTEMENSMFTELLITVCLAGGGGMIVLFAVIWFLSYWIVKPASDAFIKQKRFISEAGHELKTPITVISASLDLLQKSEQNSERWISNIKEQVNRLSAMTGNLLELSRVEETQGERCEFNLSAAVLAEGLTFESVAFEHGKQLKLDIAEGLMYKGNESSVRQAVSILCDNAIKHGEGEITVCLKSKQGKSVISVQNAGEILQSEQEYLFERFYRGSESRAKTEGSGLGLAILKALVQRNGWKLTLTNENGTVRFGIGL